MSVPCKVWLSLLGSLALLVLLPQPGRGQSPPLPVSASQGSLSAYERYRPSRFNLSVNGGLGLAQAVSPETLAPGEVAFAFHVTNFDRNPGDIDFFEYSFQGAVGLGKRMEAFARVSPWLRTTAVSLDPVRFPVPPLDLFVDVFPEPAIRPEPYFLFSPEVPYKTYVVGRETEIGAFSKSSGDDVFGLKWNLDSEDRGGWAGVGVRGYIEVPTENPEYNAPHPRWRRLAGVSGKIDYGFEFLFSKRWRRTEVLANVGYKRVGDPERGLRVQFVDSSRTNPEEFLVGDPIQTRLDLPDELRLSAGFTVPFVRLLDRYWWFFAEFNHKRFVGSHTPIERVVHPAEASIGLQYNIPWFPSVGVGGVWQLLLNDAGDGGPRTSRLLTPDGTAGDVNFSPSVDAQLSEEVGAWLGDRGASFTAGSSRVFSTNNPAFDSWRNIPVSPGRIRAEGGGNVLVFLTWRIGSFL